MKIGKIESLQPNGTWEGNHGLMYKSEVVLDNGESGEVSAKKPDRWSVGDEVQYTVSQTKNGNKFSFNKVGFVPENNPAQSGAPVVSERDNRIGRQWAINTSLNYLQLVTTSAGQITPNAIASYARILIDMREDLDTFKMDEAASDDLPF